MAQGCIEACVIVFGHALKIRPGVWLEPSEQGSQAHLIVYHPGSIASPLDRH
jgi:hypothetical protein